MLRIFLTLLLWVLPALAHAQAPLDQALREMFESDERGLRLLRDNGVRLGRVLTIERLPSDQHVVEVELELAGKSARYPLKVGRRESVWRLEWQPDGVYVAALLNMLKNDALPDLATSERWVDVDRLPAMPVIATRQRFVTPFGEVALNDRDEDAPPGALDLSPGLVRATQWWVKKVLDDDPAPAGVDLLLDPQLSWKATNKLLFNLSTVGLYQVTIVTRDGGAVRVASPVRQANFALVVYALEHGYGLRVATSDGVVPGDGCAPEMTVCVTGPEALPRLLETLETPVAPVMVAAASTVTTRDALEFAQKLVAVLGLGPHQLLVGYVQK